MARYLVKAAGKLITSEGPIPAGTTVAILETGLQPQDLAGWLLYDHAKAIESDEAAELLTRESVQQARTAAEAPPEPEPEQDDDSDLDDDVIEDEPKVEQEDTAESEHWADDLALDSRTVDALDDAGIASIEELRAKMNADEKIRGIGELREQEIMEAFEKLDAE